MVRLPSLSNHLHIDWLREYTPMACEYNSRVTNYPRRPWQILVLLLFSGINVHSDKPWCTKEATWGAIQIRYTLKSRLTSSCPCPFWMVVSSLGEPVPSVSQLQLFFYWRHSSPPPVLVFSPPDSSFLPGASAWAAQTSHEARDDGDGKAHNVRQTRCGILSFSGYFMLIAILTSFSFSFSSASVSFTLLTNICLISSSLRCRSTRNSFLLASYVSWRLKIGKNNVELSPKNYKFKLSLVVT